MKTQANRPALPFGFGLVEPEPTADPRRLRPASRSPRLWVAPCKGRAP